ncbi:MAG: response regulator [Planctomycetota bacterium]
MAKPLIVCVDDQREVLQALERDLQDFADACELITCESADEAWEELDHAADHGQPGAVLLCDQVMPGSNGVDLMKRLRADSRFEHLRMALVTGQATHADTIEAINQAHLQGYIAKPWQQQELVHLVSRLLTEHLVATGADTMAYGRLLDQDTLLAAMRKQGSDS